MSKEFVFNEGSDHNDDNDDTFEDSVETLESNIDNLLTPKAFKSSFAKIVEAKSTPNSSRPKRGFSLAGLSPIEPSELKKSKSVKAPGKSSLPRLV